jgi:hypothetical protein
MAIMGWEWNHFGHGYPQQLNAVPGHDGDLFDPLRQYRRPEVMAEASPMPPSASPIAQLYSGRRFKSPRWATFGIRSDRK